MKGDLIRAPADVVRSLPALHRVVFEVLVRSGKAEVMDDDAPNQVSA